MTGEERCQKVEVEPGQPVLVFYDDLIHLLLFNQLEDLMKFWSGVAHARADFLVGFYYLVLFLDAVGENPPILSLKVALLLLFVAAYTQVHLSIRAGSVCTSYTQVRRVVSPTAAKAETSNPCLLLVS